VRKTILRVAAGAALVFAASAVNADEFRDTVDDSPSAGAMAFDLLVVRPVGLVATVLGTGLFVLQLPLSFIQGEAPSDPAQKLVVEPAKFTFTRPLGAME
jgi:hypothetical protein